MSDARPMRAVKLNTRRQQVNDQVVESLERYLEDARKGDINGVCIITQRSNGVLGTEWIADNKLELLGGLAIVKQRIVDDLCED